MSEISGKSKQPISGDLSSAISSRESGSGATPLERLDGQMILPFGQAPAPARVSVQAGSGEASPIIVTYGPHGSGSSGSHALSMCLASRLRLGTDSLGSTLFRLTWKERVTPSGRRIPALRGTVRRCSARGFTSWPRPRANDAEKRGNVTDNPRNGMVTAANLTVWNRPQATDYHGGAANRVLDRSQSHHGRRNSDLALLVGLGPPRGGGLQGIGTEGDAEGREAAERSAALSSGAVRGFWTNAEWISCRDGRLRPIEPGTFPLAHGIANRVGKLRGYGDALCAEQAKGFIGAYLRLRREGFRGWPASPAPP